MNAYVFDIDGVITDPKTKNTEVKVLEHIVRILNQGDFVALNTGRQFSWINTKVLSLLSEMVSDTTLFKNVFVVGEKGNVLGEFDGETWQKKLLDDPMPKDLQDKMKALAEKYNDSLFYDDGKETMISFEMHDGFDINAFSEIVKKLEAEVTEIVEASYHDMELRIDPSRISLDIQYEDAGKHLGAERIEDFMLSHGIKPRVIYMIGDSPADSEMAEELQGAYEVIFIYVGDRTKLDTTKLTCEIIYPKADYTAGTLEFFRRATK